MQTRIQLALPLALFAAACSSESSSGPAEGGGTPIDGLYAQRTLVALVQDAPPAHLVTTTYGFAKIYGRNGAPTLDEWFCHIALDTDGPVKVDVPDAQTRSIPRLTATLTVAGTGDAAVYTRPITPTPVGARLADPVNDKLPTTADDPRVWDQDGDGHPGVTSKVSGIITGDIYAVRRERYTYELARGADGKIGGPLADTSEQVVIGASNALLKNGGHLSADPDASKSRIDLAPLDAEIDCDALVARHETLFPK